MFVVGRWGDCQLAADRLDTQFLTVAVDERHHHLPGRSSSACAKYADALRRISLARRSSFTSRSSSFNRSLSRSEEHTSELQSPMRISYAVFCLKTKTTIT